MNAESSGREINPFPERPRRKKDQSKAFGCAGAAPGTLVVNTATSQCKIETTSDNASKSSTNTAKQPAPEKRRGPVKDASIVLHSTRRRSHGYGGGGVVSFENSASSVNSSFSLASNLSRSLGPSLSPQKRRNLMRRKNKPETTYRIPAGAMPRPQESDLPHVPQSPGQKPKHAVSEPSSEVPSTTQNDGEVPSTAQNDGEVEEEILVLSDREPSFSNFGMTPDEGSNQVTGHGQEDMEQFPGFHPYFQDPKILAGGREYVSIHDDVYNLFFMGRLYSHAFYYSSYVFALKMTLYTFLAWEVFQTSAELSEKHSAQMLAAQFLMLPIAVAMQDDLTATFYLIANIKYCESIEEDFPCAKGWKFYVATACRAIDGFYSLIVNFVVLVSASDILSLFLNFAALQFLQTIDNIALDLAADGFLTEKLEEDAVSVQKASLPKRSEDNWLRSLDTILYSSTVAVLVGCWALVAVWNY